MIPKNVREGANAIGLEGERASFQIEANGKAFRTLIDGLYSNKIRAVIRELSSNARDAHIDAGNSEMPFEVTIPTNLNPTFRVRDYGTSLSHDDVMVLYTTIFRSTKEETNEQTGQLGLGSKSPFAYTDTFSVVAIKDGERRVYVAYLETDGVPCITHVSTEPSDEPQGFEVSFPAKRHDMQDFQEEMHFVAMGYDPGSMIVHGMDLRIGEPRLSGEGWNLYPNQMITGGWRNRNYVRMGTVVYPVDGFRLHDVSDDFSIIIDIPLGSADVTASRESLSMDDDTRQIVRDAFSRASGEITALVEEKVAEAGTSRVARAKANHEYGSILPRLSGNTNVSLLDNDGAQIRSTTDRRVGDILENAFYFGKSQSIRRYHNARYLSSVRVDLLEKVKVIVNDPTMKVVRRNKRIQSVNNPFGLVLVLSLPTKAERRKAISWIKECWELNDDQFILTETIPDCPPPKRPSGPRKPPRALKAGQYWMPRQNGIVLSDIYGNGERQNGVSISMSRAMNLIGMVVPEGDIFWVNERDQIKFEAKGMLPESKRLDKVVEARVVKFMAKQPLDEAIMRNHVLEQVGRYNQAFSVVLREFFPEITITEREANAALHAANIARIDLQNSPILATVESRIEELIEEYPLLFQRSDEQHFIQYVNAVKAIKS